VRLRRATLHLVRLRILLLYGHETTTCTVDITYVCLQRLSMFSTNPTFYDERTLHDTNFSALDECDVAKLNDG